MATGKYFYWVKLFESFFRSPQGIYLSKLGDNYGYLYLQILVLVVLNTGGRLEGHAGQASWPYTVNDIQKMVVNSYSIEFIEDALEKYEECGAMTRGEDGILFVTNFESLVGKETDYAGQKREQRRKNRVDNVQDNVLKNVHTEKEIEKEIEIELEKDKDIELEKEAAAVAAVNTAAVLQKWTDASGKKPTKAEKERLTKLFNQYGEERMLYGIDQCVSASVVKLNYLTAVLEGRGERAAAEDNKKAGRQAAMLNDDEILRTLESEMLQP